MKKGVLCIVFCLLLTSCARQQEGIITESKEEIIFAYEEESVPESVEIGTETEEKEEAKPSETEETETMSETETTAKIPIEKRIYIKCECDGLNVRSRPSTNASVVGKTEKGDLVTYRGQEGEFYKTYYKGKDAYVSSYTRYTSLVTLDCGGEEVEKVLQVGERYLGTKYVYGATRFLTATGTNKYFSDEEFDCSSFVQYMFYEGAGVRLRETTRTQVGQGTKVNKEDLRRGDLIFMTNASRKNLSGVERIGHVAVYLGHNYILHTASDYAVIEQMNATRWNNYVEARRIL